MGKPGAVVDVEYHTAEGPLWHPGRQRLYWVDIPRGRLYVYDPRRDSHQRAYEREGATGGFTIQRDGRLLLFEEAGRIETLDPEDGGCRTVVDAISGERASRFNDVVAMVSEVQHRSEGAFPDADTHDHVRYPLETFGRERVAWGSDFPNVSDGGFRWLRHRAYECTVVF